MGWAKDVRSNLGINVVLFTITCETCASRLQVKQKSAIGQVLSCPKCGSMVEIQPPEGWEMPDAATGPPRQPKAPRDPSDSQATVSGEFGDFAANFPADKSQKKPTQPTAPRSSTNAAPNTSAAPQNAADSHWQSDGTGQRSNALAWIAGIIGICLVAVVLILYMVSSMLGTDHGGELAENSSTKTAAAKLDPLPTSPEKGQDPVKDADADAGDKDKQKPPSGEAEAKDPATEKNKPSNPTAPTPPEDASASAVTDNSAKPKEPDNAEGGKQDSDFELDPEKGLAASGNTITMEQEQDRQSILDEFSGIGDLVFDPGIDMDDFRDATSDDQTQKYGIGKVYVPVPKALRVNPETALQEIYPGISYQDQPLIDFARNLFSLTQVPFQLDSQAVLDGQLDPYVTISVAGSQTNISDLLTQALEAHNLEWNWNTDKNIVVISAKTSEQIEPYEIALDPILGITQDNVAKLINGIQLIIAPETWNTNGGSATIKFSESKLELEQTPAISRQVQSLIDKLTIAAKLKADPQNKALAESLTSVFTQSAKIRESDGKFYSLQLQPIAQILKQLRDEEGVTILLNWNEMAKENWNPNLRVPWLSKERSFEKTLRELTNSMGLAYRLVNQDTLEITTKQKYWSATRLEIYPCQKQLQKRYTGDQIIQFLKEGIAADLPRQSLTQVIYSPDYECVIAVLPDPLHIRVEKILAQLADRE